MTYITSLLTISGTSPPSSSFLATRSLNAAVTAIIFFYVTQRRGTKNIIAQAGSATTIDRRSLFPYPSYPPVFDFNAVGINVCSYFSGAVSWKRSKVWPDFSLDTFSRSGEERRLRIVVDFIHISRIKKRHSSRTSSNFL